MARTLATNRILAPTTSTPVRRTSSDKYGASSSSPYSPSLIQKPLSGNLLIATVYGNSNTAISFTDNLAMAWSQVYTTDIVFNSAHANIFYKLAVGTETSVTITISGATAVDVTVFEYSGVSNVIDASNSVSTNSSVNTITTGAINTTNANDLIFLGVGLRGGAVTSPIWNSTSGSPTLLWNGGTNQLICGFYIPGTTESAWTGTCSWTQSGGGAASGMAVAFLPAVPRTLAVGRTLASSRTGA